MLIGHFGVALAAKKFAPQTSLGTTVFAAEFVDLLWPILLLLGIEHVSIAPGITRMSPFDFTEYPISHSLVSGFAWAAVIGGAYYLIRRYSAGAWIVALAVLSHWLLDWLVHRPDLLIVPRGTNKFGLGLWNHPLVEIPLEITFFAAGVWTYSRYTRAADPIGRYGFWSLVVLLLVGWVSTLLGNAPPSVPVVAWSGLSMFLIVLWAWWADKHREVIAS